MAVALLYYMQHVIAHVSRLCMHCNTQRVLFNGYLFLINVHSRRHAHSRAPHYLYVNYSFYPVFSPFEPKSPCEQ